MPEDSEIPEVYKQYDLIDEIINHEHYITKYPNGKIKTGELVLYKDGTLKYQTVFDNEPSNTIFEKKYKNIPYAKKKFKILKDNYFTF